MGILIDESIQIYRGELCVKMEADSRVRPVASQGWAVTPAAKREAGNRFALRVCRRNLSAILHFRLLAS